MNAHIVRLFPPYGRGMTVDFQSYCCYRTPRGTPSVEAQCSKKFSATCTHTVWWGATNFGRI